jgi:hypothetical protein
MKLSTITLHRPIMLQFELMPILGIDHIPFVVVVPVVAEEAVADVVEFLLAALVQDHLEGVQLREELTVDVPDVRDRMQCFFYLLTRRFFPVF